jgi:phosphoribosylamine---glycine ligase
MKVVLIGSGGREHALAYQISKSASLTKLYIAPGNPGTENLGENISLKDNDAVAEFCLREKIDLVVIGPEIPLVYGLANLLRLKGIKVFGPDSAAAQIEGDKSFSKWLMAKYEIPTAAFKVFEKLDYKKAIDYLDQISFPTVIKASGLAAGKGVLICNNYEEAKLATDDIFKKEIFGGAGDVIVIEEFMQGEEASVFAITDGERFICLPPAQDHKRIGNNDTGKNTGGMGAYAPAPIVNENIQRKINERIIRPTLEGLKNENRKFIGCLYCGLMIKNGYPKVVEFNCRFGDPETQVVVPLLEGDFLKLLYSAANGRLDMEAVKYNGGSSVCVVAASKGYPDEYKKGFEIKGLDNITQNDIIVFHAGTKRNDNKIFTNGGRVLGVTSVLQVNDLQLAKKAAYDALKNLSFKNIYYRDDISDKAFKNE